MQARAADASRAAAAAAEARAKAERAQAAAWEVRKRVVLNELAMFALRLSAYWWSRFWDQEGESSYKKALTTAPVSLRMNIWDWYLLLVHPLTAVTCITSM